MACWRAAGQPGGELGRAGRLVCLALGGSISSHPLTPRTLASTPQGDFFSLHMPLTPNTKGMFNDEAFAKVRCAGHAAPAPRCAAFAAPPSCRTQPARR